MLLATVGATALAALAALAGYCSVVPPPYTLHPLGRA